MIDDQVRKAKINLILSEPFWGSLVNRLELKETDEKFFSTDGKYIYVPPTWKDYSYDELKTILAHQTWHNGGLHLFRRGDRDPKIWKKACDAVTNYMLQKSGFKMPADSYMDPRFQGKTPEQAYEILQAEAQKQPQQGQNQKQNGQGKGNGQGQGSGQSGGEKDDNSSPQDKKDKQDKDKQDKGEKGWGGGKDENSNDIKDPNKGDNGKDKGKDGKGEGEGESDKPIDNSVSEQDWIEATAGACQNAKAQGKMPGDMEEFINSYLFPKVDWTVLLYRNLQQSKGQSDYTSYPFNKLHAWRGVFLPSLTGEFIEVVVGCDTSGSISNKDLERYFSELRGICSIFGDYKIYFAEADSAVHKFIEVTAEDDLPTVAVGRGGTDFRPIFNLIDQEQLYDKPVVYFTDLDGSFPEKPPSGQDVFWVIRKSQYRGQTVPFGTIIKIDDE